MSDYRSIATQLARVRRAWKRTAALSGLAVTVLEMLGMITVVVPIDLLFRPGLTGRMALAGLLLGGLVLLFVRHVVRPLLRSIPDKQVALYVEEQNPGFEGSLLAAAEFGPSGAAPAPPALVNAILLEAERRAGQLDIRHVVDVRRLRKYGLSAVVVVAVYAAASLLFPQTVGHQAVRVLAPWRALDRPAVPAAAVAAVKAPVQIVLVQTNVDVLRGSAWRLEAALSRDSETPVQVHFRSFAADADESRWYALPMKTIEKLHGYEAVLADINEDMECYVSAESTRSATCRIRVYDPLVVEGVETVLHYPEYLSLPDRAERRSSGDIAAPKGSTLTVRIVANRPITSGRLIWEDGAAQPLAPVAGPPPAAAAVFEAVTNRAYRYHIEDAMGQVLESPSPAYVQILPDNPPAISLKQPMPVPESITPLGEIMLDASVIDDFGVAAAEFVYRRGGETEGPEQRLPLALAPAAPGAETSASMRLELERLQPTVKAGEVLTWHVEVRDRKGQTAATDLMVTPVRHFEIWAAEEIKLPHASGETPPSLVAILQAAWQIASRRAQMAPREMDRQMTDLAQAMINAATGKVWEFLTPKADTPPDMAAKMARVNALASEGHVALGAHTIDPAVDKLRQAVMLMVAMGLVDNIAQLLTPPAAQLQATETSEQVNQQMQALAQLERQAAAQKPDAQQERKQEKPDQTAEVQGKLDELARKQKAQADQARELEKKAQANPDPEANQNQRQQNADSQRKLAEEVRKEADKVEKAPGLEAPQRQKTAEAMRDAARKMATAAAETQKGRMEKAVQEADAAHRALTTIRDELNTTGQQQIAEALNRADAQAEKVLRQQVETKDQTHTAAAKPPPQAQRESQALAKRQAQIKNDLDALQETVAGLKQVADRGEVRPETAKHVQDADRELKRSRVAQKMVNATVALTAAQPGEAEGEQQKAIEALQKAQGSIRQAADTLATGHEQELRRAKGEAEQAQKQIAEMQKPQPAGEAPQERGAAAEDALATASRLERHVREREFVTPEAVKQLQQRLQAAQSGGGIQEEKEKALALAAAVGKVRTELDAAWEKLQANKRLYSSQREECPPQYRSLVNAYFERLSTQGTP